jgi:hypothetical protein
MDPAWPDRLFAASVGVGTLAEQFVFFVKIKNGPLGENLLGG